ncbi:Ribonuclease H2 subunit A [Auxenochlorella protothecoides]|uniref:Ribonuclease n=1 Tax=Auxenochlorella protothecoides TaxID=3075 RepID=A0A087SRN6_AUXPR|nr:Ribonuclease H2 subunit A [Auxenochlorella protothecoides]KFM28390.1 Ribonuclease H2 subunit A [Auxenochlorella protothecoides]
MVMIQDEESVTVSCSDHPPQAWYSEPCMLGIDEAGRGPVLGPMVYAAAFCPCSTDLTSKAFADSKTLTEARREALLAQLQADPGIGFRAESLSAAFISGRMLARDRHSLNELANDSTARLIAGVVAAGVNLTHAYIDTVGDADKHRSRLLAQFPAIHFTVCPKADSLYPIVSAASIVAKVTRDRQLSAYTCPEGPSSRDREYGCGAFADSKTLTEARREALLAQLQADPGIGFRAESLSAAFISGRMLARDRHSLNELANDSTARLIAGVVAAGVNLTHAYIDTVGDADKHRSRLLAQFPAIHFTVCPKADSLYPIVSAASIVAKVTRDRQLSAYTCPEGPSSRDREYGCGYPGELGRPCTPLLEAAAAVPVAWECEADDGAEGQQTLGWRAGAKRKAAGPRHAFFHMRRLALVGGGTFVRGASLHA